VIEKYRRLAKSQRIKPYCFFSGEDCFMEVTEWSNTEGFDCIIEKNGTRQSFSMTWGDFECFATLVNYKDETNV